MQLELDRSLDLPVPAATAWNFLGRIEDVASCFPGAVITETIDPTHYRGKVSVRIGPASLEFLGTIEILSRDPAKRELHIAGKGADRSGSAAEMELTASVAEAGAAASRISGVSKVSVNGKAAAFGARLINAASEQLIKQFFANLSTKIEAEAVASEPQPAAAGPAATAPAQRVARPAPPPPPAAAPLNGIAFFWQVLKSFIAGLFVRDRSA